MDVALEAAAERHIDIIRRLLFEECVARVRHNPDDFDALSGANLTVCFVDLRCSAALAAVGRRCDLGRELYSLSERIAFWPELLRQLVVNNCHRGRAGLRRLSGGKGAATQKRQASGLEIIRSDAAVPGVAEIVRCRPGLRFLRRRRTGALHALAVPEHPERYAGGDAGALHTRQRRELRSERAVELLR